MDFVPGDDELALAEGTRQLCRGRFPLEELRAGGASAGLSRWAELGEAGIFSLRQPGDGAGLGMLQAAMVFEELGRALVPGPLVATHLAAGLVEGAATGEAVVTCVARPSAGARLPALVEHLEAATAVVVADADGLWQLDPAMLRAEALPNPLDPLTPVHVVHDLPRGEALAGSGEVSGWEDDGAVLTAALLVGIAAEACDLATSYAKQREQFGRPIGAFQAVKHLLADMAVRAEVARSALWAAAAHRDDPATGDAHRAASVAKVQAGDAGVANSQDCVQVHGGMGYTWEVDAHLYLKRAAVLECSFGTSDHHAELLARAIA